MAASFDLKRLENALQNCGVRGPYRNFLALLGGCVNQSFSVETGDGPVFVKVNAAASAGFFLREREGLEALAKAVSLLRIPMVIGSVDGEDQPRMLILEYLEPVSPSTRMWETLGRGLAELHQCMETCHGFHHDNFLGTTPQPNGWMKDWNAFFAERRIGHLVKLLEQAGELPPQTVKIYERLLEKIPALLSHRPPPSLLHGDLWSGNFLATKQGPALIDPAVYFGDREMEWAMMRLFGGFPETVFTAYQEIFPLPTEWRERLPLYQLYHVLNHQLLFGGGYGAQALEIARRYI